MIKYNFEPQPLILLNNQNNNLVFDKYTNLYRTPKILINMMEELTTSDILKALVIKGGRGSGKSTVAIHYTINLMLWKKYKHRNFIFGGWKKEDTKETFNKIELEIKRLKDSYRKNFEIKKTTKEITYKPNNTKILFIPLTDFMDGGTKINNLNRLKAFNNVALWVVDEAVFITKEQLNIMFRTSRENINALKDEYKGNEDITIESNSKMIFLLNPSKPNGDDVVNYFKDRRDGKINHINIDDLPVKYQSKELLNKQKQDYKLVEANKMNIEEYNHIWRGEPQYNLHYQPFSNIKTINYQLIKDKLAGTSLVAVLDIAGGGGDNTVLMYGCKIVNDYYVFGYSSNKATADDEFLNLIKIKQQQFNNPIIKYEKNGVGGSFWRIFKQEGIKTESYSQDKNKELKISSSFKQADNIYFIIDGSKECNLCLNNIVNFNPSKSKHDDEVDMLSELIKRLETSNYISRRANKYFK